MANDGRMSFKLGPEERRALERVARDSDLSMSQVIRNALRAELARCAADTRNRPPDGEVRA